MSGERLQTPRVLVVRSDELRDRVAAALAGARLPAQVDSSPSYLSAMGWLTQERVDVVIGPVSAMTGMVGSTARALRRLAPGTRLVAVAGEHEQAEADAALTAGFDQCVPELADATALLASLRLVTAAPDPVLQVEEAVEQAADSDAVDSGSTGVASQEESTALPTTHGDVDWVRNAFEQPQPIQPTEGMGDVDLAEAVLRGDGSLITMALRLLQEQSGVRDAGFVPAGGTEPEGVSAAEVVFNGELLGWLTAESVGVAALGSWAAWLARWAALGNRQDELYQLAMRDELTGIWNRRYFDLFLEGVLDRAANGRQQVTLLLFDIDNFKLYNDNYGHPAGDAVLKATARMMQSVIREHDVVARIGGDEFAVVFWDKGEPRHLGSQHPDNVIGIAKRFQQAIWDHQFPELGKQAVGNLTVSGGLAGFPWDGRTAEELVACADAMAMQSKRQGKNVICFGPGAAPNGNGKH